MKSHYSFHCTLIAAKCIFHKVTKFCSNVKQDIKVLCLSLQLYLYALSHYTSGVDIEAKKIITEYMDSVQTCFVEWLERPDIGFGNHLDGKSNSKIRDEIKVCDS